MAPDGNCCAASAGLLLHNLKQGASRRCLPFRFLEVLALASPQSLVQLELIDRCKRGDEKDFGDKWISSLQERHLDLLLKLLHCPLLLVSAVLFLQARQVIQRGRSYLEGHGIRRPLTIAGARQVRGPGSRNHAFLGNYC